jgi:hypothetical protein
MTIYYVCKKTEMLKLFVGKQERKSLRRLCVGEKLLKFIVTKYGMRSGVDKCDCECGQRGLL